jgi:hypothetical protein
METKTQKILRYNHYLFRSSGFIISFLIQITILIYTLFTGNITENQFKVFDALITSSFLYQMTYVSNNFADYAIKSYLNKKGLNNNPDITYQYQPETEKQKVKENDLY